MKTPNIRATLKIPVFAAGILLLLLHEKSDIHSLN